MILQADGYNNNMTEAHMLAGGQLNCGQSVAPLSGTTYPAGTEDWFVYTWWSSGGRCKSTITFSATQGVVFDVMQDWSTVIISGATSSVVLTAQGQNFIRIRGATPGVTGAWTFQVSIN